MLSKFTQLEKVLGNGHRPFRYSVNISFPRSVTSDTDTVNTLVKATTIPGVKIQQRNFYHKGHIIPLSGMKVYDQEWSATFYLDENYKIRNIMDKWIMVQDPFLSGVISDDLLGSRTMMDAGLSMLKNGASSLLGSANDSFTPIVSDSFESAGVVGYSTPLGDVSFESAESIKSVIEKTQNFLKDTVITESTDGTVIYGEVKITALDIDDSEEIVTYTLHNAFPIAVQAVTLDDSMTANISEFTCSFAFSHYTISKSDSLTDMALDALKSINPFK